MDIFASAREEDFIQRVLHLIETGEKELALKQILDRPKIERIDVLERLVFSDGSSYLRFHLALIKSCFLAKSFGFLLLDGSVATFFASSSVRQVVESLRSAIALSIEIAIDRQVPRGKRTRRAREFDDALDLVHSSVRSLEHVFSEVNIEPMTLGELASGKPTEGYDREDARQKCLLLSNALLAAYLRSANLTDDWTVLLLRSNLKHIERIVSLVLSFILQTGHSELDQKMDLIYAQKLADALDEVLYVQRYKSTAAIDIVARVIESLLENSVHYVTLEGVDKITSNVLNNQIGPYIQALDNYLRIYAEFTGKEFEEIRIIQIHNEAPKFELVGLGDLIRALSEVFSFRIRRDNAHLREIEIEKKKLEQDIARKKYEQDLVRMELEKTTLSALEEAKLKEANALARKAEVEHRQALLDLEQREYEFLRRKSKGYLEDAAQILDRHASEIAPELRPGYLIMLAANLRQMDETGLQGRFGSHDAPRPMLPDVPPPDLPKRTK